MKHLSFQFTDHESAIIRRALYPTDELYNDPVVVVVENITLVPVTRALGTVAFTLLTLLDGER
jgi:hypothetical protein